MGLGALQRMAGQGGRQAWRVRPATQHCEMSRRCARSRPHTVTGAQFFIKIRMISLLLVKVLSIVDTIWSTYVAIQIFHMKN